MRALFMLCASAAGALHFPNVHRSSPLTMGFFDAIKEKWDSIEVNTGKSAYAVHVRADSSDKPCRAR